MANYQNVLNVWSRQYSNWTNEMPFRWMLGKQCMASESNQFNEMVAIPVINQSNFFGNGQYVFSMVVLMVILLLFRRATTSITKDDPFAYLCKDLVALLKLVHWKNCNYSSIAFTIICFIIFVLLLPLLLSLWLCMLFYRQYIHCMIKVSLLYSRFLLAFVQFLRILYFTNSLQQNGNIFFDLVSRFLLLI